ncbi:MAG: phytoene desaturase family protein [Deinococcales bacterium]
MRSFYRIFDHKKRKFDYNDDEMFILQEIDKLSPEDKRGYLNFVHKSKEIFEKGFVELADKPFLKWVDMLAVAPDLIQLEAHKSVYGLVSKYIQDDFLRQVFSFHPLLIGGNPFEASSIYAMIHYLERKWGVHYVKGGTAAAVEGLGKLIRELGGKIHLNAEASEIIVNDLYDKPYASGIRLRDGSAHYANEIVSNGDVASTYRYLIDEKYRKVYSNKKLDKFRYSMSLVVIYFGTKRLYRDQGLAHHNIILGPRYKGLLDDIFSNKVLADDFSLYLHMPTLTDPSIASSGHESFYVLSPVPNLDSGTDWRTAAKPYRDRIMQFLEDNYLPDLQANIVTEHMIDPLHFQNTLNSYKGAFASIEPVLRQSAYFRPHNKSEDLDHRYFVGAGTHPGAGLPGVLSSAKIAEKLIGPAAF